MLRRTFTNKLNNWYLKTKRKPLVVRGARQVGKTTTVKEFAKDKHLVYLNLEKSSDRNLFSEVRSAKEILKVIETSTKQTVKVGESLVFIDEIQESTNAMNQLRFLYEELPDLHVVAAGSLLEIRLKEGDIRIPVGRVEYEYMSTLTFEEFLYAKNEIQTLEFIKSLTVYDEIPQPIHQATLDLYREFTLIGGLPEIVANYVENNNYQALEPIYESIITGFIDDINKYSKLSLRRTFEFVLESMPYYAGSTITYNKFHHSEYTSKQTSAVFKTLQEARLLKLIRPTDSLDLPIKENLKAKPKLVIFDTGLISYTTNLVNEYSANIELNNIYKGQIAEQAVGLSLWQQTNNHKNSLHYWTRFKSGFSAEIDYIFSAEGSLFPVEVKSGAVGSLKSLHGYIDKSKYDFGIRISSSNLNLESLKTYSQKNFRLLNLPHYLTFRLLELIETI